MKILHVIADLNPSSGGPPKAALETCQSLVREGQQVTLFTTNLVDGGTSNVPLGEAVNVEGVNIYYFPCGKFRKWPVSIPMARAIRENINNFDIVEIHGLYLFPSVVTAYYCRKYKIPYLILPHGSLDPFLRKKGRLKKAIYHLLIEKRNLNNAAAIHYTAEEEKNLAHSALKIRAPALVVPLGLNTNEYSQLPKRNSFRSKYPEVGDKLILLSLGRINFKKGFDLLTKAFGQVAQLRPDARLVIAGPEDTGYGDQVRRWLAEFGVLDKTIFTGMLSGREKLAALADADIFVLPSYTENFGIALVEAMACGLPVITTYKVNIWREIAQAGAGEIIHCDPDELKNAMIKLLDHPDLRKQYGANGRLLVETKYRWDIIARQLVQEYEKIIERNKNS